MTRSLPQGLQRTSSSQSTTNKSIPLDLNRRPAEITFQPASFVLPAGLIVLPAGLISQLSGFADCGGGRVSLAWFRRNKFRLHPSHDSIPPTTVSRAPGVRGAHASLSLPLSAASGLHEIHLARQSSLQVAIGHITVPGGIKLCSPGTFWVANYLIINNGSYQVNFTKPNSATIRYTNSVGSCRWNC